MLKTNYESNACLLLETDRRWLLWRLGLLLRALKSGLWPVMSCLCNLDEDKASDEFSFAVAGTAQKIFKSNKGIKYNII